MKIINFIGLLSYLINLCLNFIIIIVVVVVVAVVVVVVGLEPETFIKGIESGSTHTNNVTSQYTFSNYLKFINL